MLGQHHYIQCHTPHRRADKDRLMVEMTALAFRHARHGYRQIAALLRQDGWEVNAKRVERLWLHDGSCVRLRAEEVDRVRSYDFGHYRTHNCPAIRMLNVLDETTCKSLAIRVWPLSSKDVSDALTDPFLVRRIPAYIRSDVGPASVADVRQ